MKRAFILAMLWPLGAAAEEAKPTTAIQAAMVLKVADRNEAAEALIAGAEELGGYFASRTDEGVTLKVPVARHKSLIAKVEALGKVVERTLAAQDLSATLREQRTLLASRKAVLARYFAVLKTGSPDSVVQVESQMTQLVQQIESLEGSIRQMEHQLALAQVTVRFEFPDRRPPSRDGTSSFAWLNTVNLADLLEEFGHEE